MAELTDKFPTSYYQTHGILTCPNGDKLRSDAEGLFCWMDGDRFDVEVLNGKVFLKNVILPIAPAVLPAVPPAVAPAVPPVASPKSAKKPAGDKPDANG